MILPSWDEARAAVHEAAKPLPFIEVPLADADGFVLAEALTALTPLPPFDTSSVDGYAVRGTGPWRLVGQVLAGGMPAPLEDGTAVEIATGAMVPEGADHVVRVEHSTVDSEHRVHAEIPDRRDWRDAGEEARAGEALLPAGTAVTPGVIGLAASAGYDWLPVRRRPRVATLVFGDELLTSGPPVAGRIRDSLGSSIPAWLRRLGADAAPAVGPVEDTLEAHIAAIRSAAAHADVVATTGGTMHGPVDHLHPALEALGARYVVNTVKVRPGFPMLVAQLPDGTFVAGLPGNPQSAVVALMSLVAPLLAGLGGRDLPSCDRVTLAGFVGGRGDFTHLALVDGGGRPVRHVGSAMLRGVASAYGFAVIRPGEHGEAGDVVDLLRLPLRAGE